MYYLEKTFMRVFDLAAAATVVDIMPKLISATRPLGHSATRPRRHVAFLDKPSLKSNQIEI